MGGMSVFLRLLGNGLRLKSGKFELPEEGTPNLLASFSGYLKKNRSLPPWQAAGEEEVCPTSWNGSRYLGASLVGNSGPYQSWTFAQPPPPIQKFFLVKKGLLPILKNMLTHR